MVVRHGDVHCKAVRVGGWVVTWESSSVDEGMQVRNDNHCFFLVLSPNLNGHLRGSTCLNPPSRFIFEGQCLAAGFCSYRLSCRFGILNSLICICISYFS